MKTTFNVEIYEQLIPQNDTLSKSRCRIFYKGLNRNGTFISDEFAEKLIATIPYTPVKGIFDTYEGEYTDHGDKRSLGRIYGVVPENYNFKWEKHLDNDGVEREYACVDVLIYTGLYQEATSIVGSPQSMELWEPSIKGKWGFVDGKRCYIFEDASFLGLQVLGQEVEPCFEGAGFFSLLQTLDNYQNTTQEEEEMLKPIFKLSDATKGRLIWDALNSNYNEKSGWIMEYELLNVYDDYAVAYDIANNIYQRVYYTKDDTNDTVQITNMEQCFIVDVTPSEKQTLETLQALNGGNYEKIDETYSNLVKDKETADALVSQLQSDKSAVEAQCSQLQKDNEQLSSQISGYQTKISEKDEKIQEQDATISTLNQNIAEKDQTVESLNSQLETLNSYKLSQERKEKQDVLNKFSAKLDAAIIEKYTADIDAYSVTDLKKNLAYEFVENTPSVFSKREEEGLYGVIPKPEPLQGIEAILARYENKD